MCAMAAARSGWAARWLGRAQKAAADALGVPLDKVVMHNQLLGGGFGRRLETDYVFQAVKLAKNVEGPVKITWSREEDMRHDYYRYLNHSRITVGLDAAGQPVSWRHRVVGPNIMSRFLPIYQKDGVDLDIVGGASGPYDLPNVFIEYTRQEAPNGLNTGNWRGVGATRNVFMVESVIDDLAAACQARSGGVSARPAQGRAAGARRARHRREHGRLGQEAAGAQPPWASPPSAISAATSP